MNDPSKWEGVTRIDPDRPAISSTDIRGVWTDLKEAKRWYPVLQLIKEVEAERTVRGRMESIEPLACFIVETAFGVDPDNYLLIEAYREFLQFLRENKNARRLFEKVILAKRD